MIWMCDVIFTLHFLYPAPFTLFSDFINNNKKCEKDKCFIVIIILNFPIVLALNTNKSTHKNENNLI